MRTATLWKVMTAKWQMLMTRGFPAANITRTRSFWLTIQASRQKKYSK